jgi:hypothetical protein
MSDEDQGSTSESLDTARALLGFYSDSNVRGTPGSASRGAGSGVFSSGVASAGGEKVRKPINLTKALMEQLNLGSDIERKAPILEIATTETVSIFLISFADYIFKRGKKKMFACITLKALNTLALYETMEQLQDMSNSALETWLQERFHIVGIKKDIPSIFSSVIPLKCLAIDINLFEIYRSDFVDTAATHIAAIAKIENGPEMIVDHFIRGLSPASIRALFTKHHFKSLGALMPKFDALLQSTKVFRDLDAETGGALLEVKEGGKPHISGPKPIFPPRVQPVVHISPLSARMPVPGGALISPAAKPQKQGAAVAKSVAVVAVAEEVVDDDDSSPKKSRKKKTASVASKLKAEKAYVEDLRRTIVSYQEEVEALRLQAEQVRLSKSLSSVMFDTGATDTFLHSASHSDT